MLPINADNGWHCVVNGKDTAISRLAGNLMLIPLDAGTNEITLTYVPKGMTKGVAVTCIALAALAVWEILTGLLKKACILDKLYTGVSYAAMAVFAIVYAGFMSNLR